MIPPVCEGNMNEVWMECDGDEIKKYFKKT